MSNNMEEMREIVADMAEGMNMISENYNDLISIEEKIINLQKDINDIRSKSYISQNILEKCFERLGEIIVRTDDVSSVSSETKNIKKVGLDMPSHSGKSQATATADNIRTGDISLLKSKNISKGTQEMPIQKDKSLNNNSLAKDKNLSSGDNSPSKDKLLSKGENSDDILFFPEEKTENIITSSFILSEMERKYLTFSEFIYNNPNGDGYYQTSTESIYPRIIITKKTDPSFIQDAMDFGFVDRIYLSPNCEEILNDTLRTQLCKMTGHQSFYIKFFTISPEYNEDIGVCHKAYHLITINSSEESRFQINDIKPKKLGYYNRQWTKTRRALGIKAVLGRMTDLKKKNCSVHCATNNWMIILGDGKARGQRMLTDKINELDQLLMPASQITKTEAIKFMKKTKSDNEGWVTLGKKM